MKRLGLVMFMMAWVSATSSAQQQSAVASSRDIVVKTVPLHHLSSAEAVKLLSPYIQSPGAGVFEISSQIRAVTIRETPKVFAEMQTVLNQYDRDPASLTLNFQLIAAENTNTRDPGVAGLDSLLRGVLKYSGYRLLTTSVATASEDGIVSQTLSADGENFTLQVHITDVRIEGSNASVHLGVSLMRAALMSKGTLPATVLSTGVTVPVGQTVVLGTSATDNGQRALILTVRPQLTTVKR
jgi:type II secretory pathway component GspD/PulD (secretin)